MPIFRLLCSREYFPYISFALFLAVVPLYFVSTIFIAVLPLYFVYYIHGSTALIFRTLYPWLYEVFAIDTSGKETVSLFLFFVNFLMIIGYTFVVILLAYWLGISQLITLLLSAGYCIKTSVSKSKIQVCGN